MGNNVSDRIAVIHALLERVTVHLDHLELIVQLNSMHTLDHTDVGRLAVKELSIPVTLRRSGKIMRLVVHAAGKERLQGPDPNLWALIAKAHDWFSRLVSGRYDGVQAIATEEKVTSSYVTRVIYVAIMAPDLALRILKGDHPPTLNARKLLDMVPLPERWEDQRQVLGMRD